jgi:predicted AAA+ superfamily ATPase
LLGLGLSEQNFPVGKVQREWLRPMAFFEFLDALGESALREALSEAAESISAISPAIHGKAFGLFKEFMITGGMPEVVQRYDFGQFKGFLAENAVLNELLCAGRGPLFTWRGTTAEIEFLLPSGEQVIPIEVKAGVNTKAKSMQTYREKFAPRNAILLSGQGTNQMDQGLLHAPLYLAAALDPEALPG